MRPTVFPAPDPVTLPIIGRAERFAVRRLYCVGRNYADHVTEMGGDPKSSPPVFFTKSREAIVQDGADLTIPSVTENLHYEVEWVIALGPDGIWGHAVGLDMTLRDVQAAAKAKTGPWDMAKNFDNCAPCGAITPASDVDLSTSQISLTINGETRQNAPLSDMIWSAQEIITALSRYVTFAAGDLIYTGTPSGVGRVVTGDHVEARITGLAPLSVHYR